MRRAPRPVLILVAIVLAWLPGAWARAQSWPAASSMLHDREVLSHAWAVLPVRSPAALPRTSPAGREPEARFYLVHIPSRGEPPIRGSSSHGAKPGTVRVASRLSVMPRALAAVDNRVYLLFEEPGQPVEPGTHGAPPPLRRVSSISAVPAGVGDLWAFDPPDRFRAVPALPSGGEVLGFAGSPAGPVALLGDAASAEYTLLVLDGPQWRELPLPADALADGHGLSLVAIRGGVALTAHTPGGPVVAWKARWPAAGSETRDPSWNREVIVAQADPRVAPYLLQSGGVWVAPARASAPSPAPGLQLLTAEGSRWFPIAAISGVDTDWTAVPLDDVGQVALLWRAREDAGQPADAPPAARASYTMAEVSAVTGRITYQGIAQGKGPISWSDFRLLSLILLSVMTIVLLIVVRGERPDGPVVLPDGVTLAEPGQRFTATLVDAALCGSVALSVWDVPWREVFNPLWLLSARGEWTLLTWLGLGWLMCTVTEGLWGRSPGKLLGGVRVISCRPRSGRAAPGGGVGLKAAAIRNAMKWLLPPVGVLGLMSPDSRHLGDVLAGSAVVIPPEKATNPPD